MSKNKFYAKQHEFYLNKIYNNVEHIGEDRQNIEWIMKEGIWYKPQDINQQSLCDLIICYENNTAVPVELKGSNNQRSKAMKQLEQGCEFIYEVLKRQPTHGIFATYKDNKINYEKLEIN